MTVVHIKNEEPIGIIDGTNKSFTLSTIQVQGSLVVQLNGLTQLSKDIIEQQGAFMLDSPPLSGDVLRCSYLGEEVTLIICP